MRLWPLCMCCALFNVFAERTGAVGGAVLFLPVLIGVVLGTNAPAAPVATNHGLQLLVVELVALFAGQGEEILGGFAGLRFLALLGSQIFKLQNALSSAVRF